MKTTKERYTSIKKSLNNGMSVLAATKKYNASMTTISRIKQAKSYDDFVKISQIGDKSTRARIKANKSTQAKKVTKPQVQEQKKSPWDKLKSFFGI